MTDIVERLECNGRNCCLDAKAEIERLRDENARPHLNYEAVLLESKAEIEHLRADNARLRAALQTIINMHPDDVAAVIARRALDAK